MSEQQSSAALFRQFGEPRFELIPVDGIVKRATAALPIHSTLSITCSPTQGVDYTVETSIELAPQFNRVVPHIAARMVRSEEHLDKVLDKLQTHDLDEIFVVGGDQEQPLGPYRHSLDLLNSLSTRDHGLQRIGITAYPEGHPHIDNYTLAKDLVEKAPFAHYAVTQMCFDSDQVLAWLRQQREDGLQLPFYIGIPGPVKLNKLIRIAARIGVTDSLRFLRGNLRLTGKLLRGYDASNLMSDYASYLNDADYGLAGLHTYTFNELDTIKKEWSV